MGADEGALEHDREDGGADRAADALEHVQLRGRTRELGPVERGECRRHRGHEREADADPADEHRHATARRSTSGRPIRPNGIVATVHRITPNSASAAAAPAVGQLAGDRHRERRAETLRRCQQAGVDDALEADVLPVQRQQDHPAEQRGAEAEHRERGRGERRFAVQAHVEQRLWHPQRVEHERRDQGESDDDGMITLGEVKLPVAPISARP